MRYGYAWMAKSQQGSDSQLQVLQDAGLEDTQIYVDVLQDSKSNRPKFQKLLRKLKRKDVVVVKSLDRLGKNNPEVLEAWVQLTGELDVGIEVLDMPTLNTTQPMLGEVVAEITTQLLTYLVNTDKSLTRQRQADGIQAARERGVAFGRQPIERTAGFYELKEQYLKGEISTRTAGKMLGNSHCTFLRWVNGDKKERLRNKNEKS